MNREPTEKIVVTKTISMSLELFQRLEKERGLISRSVFVRSILDDHLRGKAASR